MRIAITVPSLDRAFGGPAGKARSLAGALRELGHQVAVVGVGGRTADGMVVLRRLTDFHGTPVPRSVAPLRRTVRSADVVHVLGYRDPVGTIAAYVSARAGVPYLLEPVGMHRVRLRSRLLKTVFDRVVGRRVVRNAAAVVATSRLEQRELAEDGVDPTRVVIRANGVDVDDLLPLPARGALRRRLDLPSEAPLLLALGRITAKKGLVPLVDAVAALPGVHLLVAGPDDGDGTLQRVIERRATRAVEARVTIVPGGLWGDERSQAFADADCFCLPSATENFATAAAEAASVGLPVVVSDRCGVAEWLDGDAHQVVPYGSPDSLATALAEAVHSRSRREVATATASGLREALRWSTLAKRQLSIYEEVVGS